MSSGIFSTYRQGENRVTASILAVLRSLSLGRIERLLRAMLEESEFELVRFQNQVARSGRGVPDGEILASIRILIETKTQRGAMSGADAVAQIRRHLKRLDASGEARRILLVVTPDDARPPALGRFDDPRVVWSSFAALDQAIDELCKDESEVVSERESFLLRELQKMLSDDGLLRPAFDAVVVAAANAWPIYQACHAYICQSGRSFQSVTRLAFYSRGRIEPIVPKIVDIVDEVDVGSESHKGRLGRVLKLYRERWPEFADGLHKVFLLSAPDDPSTLQLSAPIVNNLTAESGRPVAFTQGQRYVSSAALRTARVTTDLVQAVSRPTG